MSDDPTRLRNQPSLTTTTGNSWLIVGGLFAAISVGMLAALSTLQASGLAITAIAVICALYLAMLLVRYLVHSRRRRLRLLAACLLLIAAVGLGSVIAIAAINWAAF